MSTTRRSFLQRASAFLLALVTLSWVKKSKALPIPTSSEDKAFEALMSAEVPSDPYVFEGMYMYRDFGRLLDDLQDYLEQTGNVVLSADNPIAGVIGFSTFNTEHTCIRCANSVCNTEDGLHTSEGELARYFEIRVLDFARSIHNMRRGKGFPRRMAPTPESVELLTHAFKSAESRGQFTASIFKASREARARIGDT